MDDNKSIVETLGDLLEEAGLRLRFSRNASQEDIARAVNVLVDQQREVVARAEKAERERDERRREGDPWCKVVLLT